MGKIDIGALAIAVQAGLATAAANPANSLQHKDVPAITSTVTPAVEKAANEAVGKEVGNIVKTITNAEDHWYQKRTVWSTIIGTAATVAAPLLVKYGLDLSPETRESLITVCTTVGGLWAAYLAWRAGRPGVKPLGT